MKILSCSLQVIPQSSISQKKNIPSLHCLAKVPTFTVPQGLGPCNYISKHFPHYMGKSPQSPHIAPGMPGIPPLGKADDRCII